MVTCGAGHQCGHPSELLQLRIPHRPAVAVGVAAASSKNARSPRPAGPMPRSSAARTSTGPTPAPCWSPTLWARARPDGWSPPSPLHSPRPAPDSTVSSSLPALARAGRPICHRDQGVSRSTTPRKIGDMLPDATLLPELDAALYRTAAKIPGVSVVADAKDFTGRSGIGLSFRERDGRTVWVFDRKSLDFLGSADEALLAVGVADKAGGTSAT
ncbi:hypothetical protein EDD90_5287 [Streptomyces sp. Ag109_O5-1]|nr:hypothetical protein EDD90_5287 [Streptomyces sp. Ag109_O5-1]